MRAYVGLTFEEVSALVSGDPIKTEILFAATAEFVATHSELDEEEREFILTMLAAEESLDLREEGFGFVLAGDIPADVIIEEGADSIKVSGEINRDWAACIFLVSPDGEDLTWYAIQEV
ncbi:MAG: DUF6912 family protein, partial [Candidatus Planktophila sp.]